MVGNWKMNGSLAANATLVSDILRGMAGVTCRSAVCVPPVYLAQMQTLLAGSALDLGAQDVSAHASGAYTGEVSATMSRITFTPKPWVKRLTSATKSVVL